jgi:hypothetical protein
VYISHKQIKGVVRWSSSGADAPRIETKAYQVKKIILEMLVSTPALQRMGFSPILTEGTVLAHGVSMSGNARFAKQIGRKCMSLWKDSGLLDHRS